MRFNDRSVSSEHKRASCPDCGCPEMKYLPHVEMYGGYICTRCSKIWSVNDPVFKGKKN